MRHETIYCDIDGTISDDRPRHNLLNEAKKKFEKNKTTECYDEYHSLLFSDREFSDVMNYLNRKMADGSDIIFITARTTKWRKLTIRWISQRIPDFFDNNIPRRNKLYMRFDSDTRPNEIVKADQIRRDLVNSHLTSESVKFIIDDSTIILDYLGSLHPEAKLLLANCGELVDYDRRLEINATLIQNTSTPVDVSLKRLATVYLERNSLYGDNYKKFGKLMLALQDFVPGGSFPTETENDWNRLGILVMIASKLSRYCASYTAGGHEDSLDDASVYEQMLNELDREKKGAK